MEALLNIGDLHHGGSRCLVRVCGSGCEEDEDTWEPLTTLWEEQLRKIKLGPVYHRTHTEHAPARHPSHGTLGLRR